MLKKFLDEAKEKKIKILRDTENIKYGEKIKTYMKSLSQGQRIFIFMSDSYLRSPNCMYELYHIWQHSEQCEKDFINRVRIYLNLRFKNRYTTE
ncbi:TIR domain-containing protein, partial [Elstera litoralis]